MKNLTRRKFLKNSTLALTGISLAPSLITSKTHANELQTDVLIIGSGFCGTALAQRLANTSASITILESGEATSSWNAQSLNRVVGSPTELAAELSIATHRQIGGTSALWNSSCPIPDERDFHSYSEFGYGIDWPFGMDELNRYIRQAAQWLNIGVPESFHGTMGTNYAPPPYAVSLQKLEMLKKETGLRQIFPAMMGVSSNGTQAPKRVMPVAIDLPRQYNNVQLLPGACANRLIFKGNKVTGVIVQHNGRGERRLHAKHIVLACGGTQNARLLLLSQNADGGTPLSRHNGLIGHHLMDHPHQHIIGAPNSLARELFQEDTWLHAYDGYIPQKEQGLGGHVFRIGFIPAKTPSRFLNGQSNDALLVIDSNWEQEPLLKHRLRLDPEISDRFGDPIARVESSLSRLDQQAMEASNQRLANVADALCDSWKQLPRGLSSHHIMGTTPYTSPQRDGVIDANSKLIGAENLWIVGSSNFPTGLSVNPTLIATALSIKLAEHLAGQF